MSFDLNGRKGFQELKKQYSSVSSDVISPGQMQCGSGRCEGRQIHTYYVHFIHPHTLNLAIQVQADGKQMTDDHHYSRVGTHQVLFPPSAHFKDLSSLLIQVSSLRSFFRFIFPKILMARIQPIAGEIVSNSTNGRRMVCMPTTKH